MNLHPYDGKERRFRHSDADRREGLRVVARLLRLSDAPSEHQLQYDLSFSSGGIGVVDQLAITLPMQADQVQATITALQAVSPDAAAQDAAWRDDFLWLVSDEDGEDPRSHIDGSVRFINENRLAFQPECRAMDPIWFVEQSNVNAWTALWLRDGLLSFRAYDQG